MKLSSRKQLLKESDTELNKIRLRILLESDGEVDTEKIEKVAQKIADKKTEKIQSEIEKDLENLKRQSISMQREFEKANRETGVSIQTWYSNQNLREKIRYFQEKFNNREYSDKKLWDKMFISFTEFLGNFTNIVGDDDGNFWDLTSGKKIEPPSTLNPGTASIIRSVINGLSI